MTLEEYNKNLGNLAALAGERLTERVIVVGATTMLAAIQNRIFRDGLDSAGNKIGAYSTKPYYASKKQFIQKGAFKPVGKGGKDANIKAKYTDVATRKTKTKIVKQDGSDRTSMYLKDGYKEFRDIQGRPTDEVNLFMKGDLRLAYTLQAKEKEVLIGFNNELQSKKRKGQELHFKRATGTIFPATEAEKKLYSGTVMNELVIVQREIMTGI